MIIKKKAWPELFELVKEGKKNFDVRLADFDCKEGDILLLKEWDPKTKEYTGRELKKEVSFVLKTKDCEFWKKEDIYKYGFQVIQLK
ncbi:MAG: DUF3850 domain-containing protein [Candidatus Woesearchaeota archaeon]|nr:MAG: DUF3850 domain-containing protein [Candidatus Woesearchaeota archaeon]